MHVPLFNLKRQLASLEVEILQKFQSCIENTEFTVGAETVAFEKAFAALCQTKYSVGVGSGTASLLIALKAAGISEGDEVITTPLSFAASADTIALAGGTPVFVETLAETGNIDPKSIEQHITPKTKGLLIVHLYGVPCEMDEICAIAKKHHLFLIEDASHAHASLYKGQPVGSFGLGGCFSLYPSKTLGALGNAGVVVSSNKEFIKKVRMYAHHGIADLAHKYSHSVHGYNELIDNLQAAALNVKMRRLRQWIVRKTEIAVIYNRTLQQLNQPGMCFPDNTQPSLYVFAIQVNKRTEFQEFLNKKGIETGIYYPTPLHLQQSFSNRKDLKQVKLSFPLAETFFAQTMSLPLYPELTDLEVEYICQAIKEFFQ